VFGLFINIYGFMEEGLFQTTLLKI
jgi:hypothetical protein